MRSNVSNKISRGLVSKGSVCLDFLSDAYWLLEKGIFRALRAFKMRRGAFKRCRIHPQVAIKKLKVGGKGELHLLGTKTQLKREFGMIENGDGEKSMFCNLLIHLGVCYIRYLLFSGMIFSRIHRGKTLFLRKKQIPVYLVVLGGKAAKL